MHHLARQFDKEIDVAREALALDPNFMMARYRLGIGYLHQDRFELAVEELEQARKLSANSLDLLAAVGYAHGRAGHRAEARRIVRELQDAAASKRRYVSPFGLALVHLGLDDRETALTWLNRAVDERAWGIVLLGVEPALDPLRSDSRFAALVARVAR
jgi:Flp pilus assembly protein TadD